jgi:hypothetical protein
MTKDDSQGEDDGDRSQEAAPARKRGRRLVWVLAVVVPLIALLYRVFEVYHR